ncbi:hypothetical protein ETB97_001577 [Aspergillus alliaceus]|uniref:Rhodopsin domain-containing protein n=1 Tax=Petromyces alliaceus TaxID=209559 RepID=A0A8H6AFI9_PETAA|nr:hypothetical protein ETB97_001577 [Aspergillus burnettii]
MEISNEQAGLLVVAWAFGGISVLVVALRVLAKIKIQRIMLDDVIMVFALCLGLIASALLTCAILYGYDQQTKDDMGMNATEARKFGSLAIVFTVACAATARTAFVLYLAVILSRQKWHRIILIALMALELAVNAVSIILVFASCNPVHAVWDYSIDGDCLLDSIQIGYGTFLSIFNATVDLYLAVVPTYIFWHLNLRLPVKLSLICLMSLGLLAMGASIGKIMQIPELQNDMLTGTSNLVRWAFIEAYVVIIVASLPCLRSLFLSGFRYKVSSKQRSRDYELTATVKGSRGGPSSLITTRHRTNSRLRNILPKPGNREDVSDTHILGGMNSVEAAEAGESSRDLGVGIWKDVEFQFSEFKVERTSV